MLNKKVAQEAVTWMLSKLEEEGCLYQKDVVDMLVKRNFDSLTNENSQGNLVVGKQLLDLFKKENESNVVWVSSYKYWRFRVPEDGELTRRPRITRTFSLIKKSILSDHQARVICSNRLDVLLVYLKIKDSTHAFNQ